MIKKIMEKFSFYFLECFFFDQVKLLYYLQMHLQIVYSINLSSSNMFVEQKENLSNPDLVKSWFSICIRSALIFGANGQQGQSCNFMSVCLFVRSRKSKLLYVSNAN